MPVPPWHGLAVQTIFGTAAIPAAKAELPEYWLYLLYRTVATARHSGILPNDARRAGSFSAAMRSRVAQDPRVGSVINEAGTSVSPPRRRR